VLPGKRGNPAGTASQMRPQSVSVWPATSDALGGAEAGSSLSAGGSVVAKELGGAEAEGESGVGPHATSNAATGITRRKRLGRVDIGRV